MNTYLARVGKMLAPTDEESETLIYRLGEGELILVRVIRVRSLPWHRLYFKMCREIGKNQDPMRDEHSIDSEVRWVSGHRTFVTMYEGRAVWEPARIAFDQLTYDEWANLWPRFELAMRERFNFGPENLPARIPEK